MELKHDQFYFSEILSKLSNRVTNKSKTYPIHVRNKSARGTFETKKCWKTIWKIYETAFSGGNSRMESTESFLLYETLGDRTFIAVWRNLLF